MSSRSLLLPAVAETGIVTWRSIKLHNRPPLPSELLSVVAVFGMLSIGGDNETWSKVATTIGWGLVIATVLNVVPSIMNLPGSSGNATSSNGNAFNNANPSAANPLNSTGAPNAGVNRKS